MATVKYYLKNSSRQLSKIYMRISISRNVQANFPLQNINISPKQWDSELMRVKSNFPNYKIINDNLDSFYKLVLNTISYNFHYEQNMGSDFFKNLYKTHIGNSMNTNIPLNLLDYMKKYIEERDVEKNTKEIYQTVYSKVQTFQKIKNNVDHLFYNDVSDKWISELIDFLKNDKNQILGNTTINTYLDRLKVILKDYQKINKSFFVPTINKLPEEERSILPTLSEKDLQVLENLVIMNERLDKIRDWIIIACDSGQRISDYGTMANFNIEIQDLISMTQRKTKRKSLVLISERVKKIYLKRGQLPEIVSDQKFNKYMKEVCALAEFDEIFEGSKIKEISVDENGKKIYRSVKGFYKRHELMTSHTCRRSFATNKYLEGKVSIPTLMSMTGHKSTEEFYKYIQIPYLNLLKN